MPAGATLGWEPQELQADSVYILRFSCFVLLHDMTLVSYNFYGTLNFLVTDLYFL